ncbi:MAG: hypothetical protein ACKO14_00350 [Armatimonadota bacterium]
MRSSAFVYNPALIWRWLAFAVTAIVLFMGALTFLLLSLFSGIRYDTIALVLLIGSLCFCLPMALAAVAPAGRGWIASISFCLVCVAAMVGMRPLSVTFVFSAIVGGGCAILLASVRHLPFGHSHSRGKLLAIGAAVVTVIALAGGLLRSLDIPAFTDTLPSDISEMLPKDAGVPTKVNVYELGGFLDSAYLVRIDAPPATLAALGRKIGKSSTRSPGGKFFSFAPYWWPKSMPKGGKVYRTVEQEFTTYPGDGEFLTMLVDPSGTRAWIHVFHGF